MSIESAKWKEKVMHSSLAFNEVYNFVKKLSVNGTITMPADKTFWNSVYGSFIDKFGICWGIGFEVKK